MTSLETTASTTSPASNWEWIQTALLAINLVWTTLCLGGYRPETMVVTGVLTGALLATHFLSRVFSRASRVHPAGWLLVPFLIYAAINVRWLTPVQWLGWRDWTWWVNMVAVFWVVLNGLRSPAPRRALFVVLVALGVVATGLGSYQHFVRPTWMMLGRVQADQFVTRASGCFGIPNSMAAFLLLLIPALGALAFRAKISTRARVFCGMLCAVLIFGLVLTISRGAWLGLVLALVAWPLFALRMRWWKRAVAALAALGALALACSVLYAVSPSVRDRLVGFVRDRGEITRPIMWRGAWELFRERPAVGSGAGSFNVLFEKFRPEGFRNEPQWAHNDYLNTLSDYGLVGFGLFFGVCAVIVGCCARGQREAEAAPADWIDTPAINAALAVGVLAFALQLFVDFHFKIPALAMAFAVIAAMIVGRCWPWKIGADTVPVSSAAKIFWSLGAIGTVAGTVFFVVPRWEGEALRYGARQRIDQLAGVGVASLEYRTQLDRSRGELARAVALDPTNAQGWADVAYAASLWAHISPAEIKLLGDEAESAAGRAISLSSVCAEFWIRRGVARDMRGRWFDGSVDFNRATTLAPASGWAWFYYADHLSRKATERGLAEAAVALCLRLDPQNDDALALRQRLAISQRASP